MNIYIFLLTNFCSFGYITAKSGINAALAFFTAVMRGVYYGYLFWGGKP
jgi:hypothetical protein